MEVASWLQVLGLPYKPLQDGNEQCPKNFTDTHMPDRKIEFSRGFDILLLM